MSRSSRRGPWLPEEDNALVELVRTQGPNNWVRISQQLQYRSPKQCRERYHQNLKPSLNHEPISTQEGEMIERLVNDMGKRWAEIARRLGNRSDNAVKNWWNGSMNRRKRNPSHGNTLKHIGNRAQPIHCGKDYRLPQATSSYRFSTDRPQPLYLGSGTEYAVRTVEVLPSPSVEFDRALIRSSIYQQPLPIERTYSPYQHSNNVRKEDYFTSSTEESQRTRLPPLRLPYLSNHTNELQPVIERPSVSPAISEFTNSLNARHPPSLVSDNQSSCSISPKTMVSPKLNGPSYWLPFEGTDSCGATQRSLATQYNNYDRHRPASEYNQALAPKTEIRHYHNHEHDYRAPTAKDSRMNVSSLLK